MAARLGERDEMPPEMDNFDSPPDTPKRRPRREGSGGVGFVIFLIFLLLVLAVVAILSLNLFGWREDHVMPFLREAPVIRNFFANAEAREGVREEARTHDELTALNSAQANRIERVEYELDALRIQLAEANARIHTLETLENEIESYRIAIREWNRMLAHTNPAEFAERFFDYVHPTYIPWLMGEADAILAFDDNTRRMVSILNNMEESSVGEMLQQYLMTDQQMMLRLLHGMGSTRLGAVLETLDSEISSVILMFMARPTPDFGAPPGTVQFPGE